MTMIANARKIRQADVSVETDRKTVKNGVVSTDEIRKIDAYWRACNYLAAGMIYLRENPLLRGAL